MSLKQRLEDDLKDAMRQGDTLRRSVIRYVRSEIHNQEIAGRKELDDDGVTGVLGRQAQQRRDSIEAYAQGNRADLVEKEKAELVIILDYLPEQMSAEEITGLVRRAIEEVGSAQVLSPIKAHLPATISYGQIRCVRAAMLQTPEKSPAPSQKPRGTPAKAVEY